MATQKVTLAPGAVNWKHLSESSDYPLALPALPGASQLPSVVKLRVGDEAVAGDGQKGSPLATGRQNHVVEDERFGTE